MAKASDLMGRSGAGGLAGGGSSPFKVPAAGHVKPSETKAHGKPEAGKPTVGHQPAGGGKAPVARRPKV